MCQEGGGISANPRPLLGVFALPMFRFAAQRPRNVLIVPLSGPSRILTVLLRTLLNQLAFFPREETELRKLLPRFFFWSPATSPGRVSRGWLLWNDIPRPSSPGRPFRSPPRQFAEKQDAEKAIPAEQRPFRCEHLFLP